MNKINTVKRDHEDLVAARLMSHLSQNPHSRQGNIPSPIDSNKNLHCIERAETKAGMIAEVYEDSKGKLFLIYRGSEVISHKTFVPGTQSNKDWTNNMGQRYFNFSDKSPVQFREAAEFLSYVADKYPNKPLVIAGQSKGGAESAYAAAMNKQKLQNRDFRVLATNADALFRGSLFADVVSNNAGITQDDPFFDNFDQVRVVSNSGDKELVSSLNTTFSDDAIYLGKVREIKMPPSQYPILSLFNDKLFGRVDNHGADNAEIAFRYTISQSLLPDQNLSGIRAKLNREPDSSKPSQTNHNSLIA